MAGAGATLWHHPPDGGAPHRLASLVIAIPQPITAQVAEVTGCRGALGLLPQIGARHTSARVVGDNLGAIRYGAGNSRFRRLPLFAQMEHALRQSYLEGWDLTWQAVRRRFNQAADALATTGIEWARALHARGQGTLRHFTFWHHSARPPPPCPPAFPAERYAHLTSLREMALH